MVEEIVIRANKWKLASLIFTGLIFVVAAIWIMTSKPKSSNSDSLTNYIVGFAGIIFFGGGTALLVFRWIKFGVPTLTLSEAGFINQTLGGKAQLILWDDVASISQMRIGRQKFVVLEIYQDANLSKYLVQLIKELKRNEASGFGHSLLVATNLLNAKDQFVFGKMEEVWRFTGHPGKRWTESPTHLHS